jgi:hypothetical protein
MALRIHLLRLSAFNLFQAAMVVALMISFLGCGRDPLGRHAVSGTVTFRGQPVPIGFVRLIPNTDKGNKGPGGGAAIKNGEFHAPANKGVVGGPYLIEIVGMDGVPSQEEGESLPDGKSLFPTIQVEYEFPNEDSTWNYDVTE